MVDADVKNKLFYFILSLISIIDIKGKVIRAKCYDQYTSYFSSTSYEYKKNVTKNRSKA